MERSAFFSVQIALVAGKVLHILLIIIVLAHCDLLLAGPVHVTFTTCPLPASESKYLHLHLYLYPRPIDNILYAALR